MCTVTYIPTKKGFIFTSNRDEKATRKTINPSYYIEDGVNLFYPKDDLAGGTWLGVSENKRLVCLLNGGFVYHNPQLKFPNSRGVVVKNILTSTNVLESMEVLNLDGVAPFTLIVVDWNSTRVAYELVWCKNKKHINKLDVNESKIWSSSTLYSEDMKTQRNTWFVNSNLCNSSDLENQIIAFHQNENLGTKETSVKMKRLVVETVSTTMVVKEEQMLKMKYFDYINNQELDYPNVFTLVNA